MKCLDHRLLTGCSGRGNTTRLIPSPARGSTFDHTLPTTTNWQHGTTVSTLPPLLSYLRPFVSGNSTMSPLRLRCYLVNSRSLNVERSIFFLLEICDVTESQLLFEKKRSILGSFQFNEFSTFWFQIW